MEKNKMLNNEELNQVNGGYEGNIEIQYTDPTGKFALNQAVRFYLRDAGHPDGWRNGTIVGFKTYNGVLRYYVISEGGREFDYNCNGSIEKAN